MKENDKKFYHSSCDKTLGPLAGENEDFCWECAIAPRSLSADEEYEVQSFKRRLENVYFPRDLFL